MIAWSKTSVQEASKSLLALTMDDIVDLAAALRSFKVMGFSLAAFVFRRFRI